MADTVKYRLGYDFTLGQMYTHGHELAVETFAAVRDRALLEKGPDWVEGAGRALINGTYGNPNHIWTKTECPAYTSRRGRDCTCAPRRN